MAKILRRIGLLPSMVLAVALCVATSATSLGQEQAAPEEVAVAAQADEAVLPTEADEAPGPIVVSPPPPGAVDNPAHLQSLTEAAGMVFDGVLTGATAVTPDGMSVVATEYVFEVSAWIKGAAGDGTVSVTALGGQLADGSGMTTGESLKLTEGDRYLVFLKPDAGQVLLPFLRVLQIHDGGNVVANEAGQILAGVEAGRLVFRSVPEVESLRYLPGPPPGRTAAIVPPEETSEPLPEQPVSSLPSGGQALSANALVEVVRSVGLDPDGPADAGIGDLGTTEGQAEPATSPTPSLAVGCGYHRNSINFYCYLPDNDNWNWFIGSGADWNNLVGSNPSGDDYLIGYFVSGGNPIRDRLPVAGDGNNNCGTPSSAQLTAGGYPTWPAMGNPNGVNFTWTSGGGCTEIVETDTFANPVLQNDEVQFRKTMTHEIGHALSLGHEDRYFALLYSGTWRQPPNYSSNWYTRMDDNYGVRSMLDSVNGSWPGTWAIDSWADMATWSQTHDSWGSPGSLIMTDLSSYSVPWGGSVDVRHLHVENLGTVAASNVYLRIYLSTNTTISAADHLIWAGHWSSFSGPGVWPNGTASVTISSSIPVGTYYIGWIVTTDTSPERSTANNTTIMRRDAYSSFSERTINVTCPTQSTPTGVSASDGTYTSYVRVTWSSVSGADAYRVYRATSAGGAKTALGSWQSSTSYNDTSATPGVTYYYWVKARNACGNESGYSSYNTGWRKLSPPTGVSASDGSYTGYVRVTWNSANGASHYRVYRNTTNDCGSATSLGSWQSGTTYNDSGATPGVTYYYWVKAATSSSGYRASDCSGSNTGWRAFDCNNNGTPDQFEALSGRTDLDGDGDVDVNDFLTFSTCFNGSLNPPKPACQNMCADFDFDGDVDVNDFLTFSGCFNGSLNPPACP